MGNGQQACSCMRVKYDPEKCSGGKLREQWVCEGCGREFIKKVDSGYVSLVGTEGIRTATVEIDTRILFDLMGIPDFDGAIHCLRTSRNGNSLKVQVAGFDDRLPDKKDYPKCDVMIKTIQGHFEERK